MYIFHKTQICYKSSLKERASTHFCMNKIKLFSCNFPFFILFIPLIDIIGIKPAPGNHESNFKKVGAILCGCNTKLTDQYMFVY